jgi:polysaccharide export outer membrane protein
MTTTLRLCGRVIAVAAIWLGSAASPALAQPEKQTTATVRASTYALGPGDKLVVWALGAEELSDRPVTVADDGYVDLPMIGRVHAAGLTPDQLKAKIGDALLPYVKAPKVSISVTDIRSQPVSIMGEVNRPGVYQVHGGETLSEVLSQAEGTRADAGSLIHISRRPDQQPLQLPNTVVEADGASEVEIRTKDLLDGKLEGLTVAPHDVIKVSKSPIVYVIGEVHKPGGFAVGERDSLTVLEVVSMAEGLDRTAISQKCRLLRLNPGSATRVDVPVDLKRILTGKKPDVQMQPDDILYVPDSKVKSGASRVAEIAIGAITSAAIYRAY